jgi:hypothetical protein
VAFWQGARRSPVWRIPLREVVLFKSSIIAGVSLFALASGAMAEDTGMRPMFARGINRHDTLPGHTPLGGLTTWTLKWTYSGTGYSAIFVGSNPKKGKSTTVPVYIIPMALTYGTTTADPTVADYTGKSPVQNTVASPIFDATTDYNQGGTDVGTTQYEDAFQRANLWGTVKSHTGYHVLLGTPTVEPVQNVTVPKSEGTTTTAFGVKVIIANINWFDPIIEGLLTTLKIPANSLPIFITTQTYLSGNSGTSGCCIGGYHSYTGTQAYSHFTYISNSSNTLAFSQDVSALSHEVGEWLDDPLTNNTKVPALCGTQGNKSKIYEVGDPLEVDANYGDYNYTLNGFVYHLQDLTLPTYYGAPAATSIPFNQTFQGTKFSVCQNGG